MPLNRSTTLLWFFADLAINLKHVGIYIRHHKCILIQTCNCNTWEGATYHTTDSYTFLRENICTVFGLSSKWWRRGRQACPHPPVAQVFHELLVGEEEAVFCQWVQRYFLVHLRPISFLQLVSNVDPLTSLQFFTFHWDFSHELHEGPSFVTITVHEEVDDLVDVVLLLEHAVVLLLVTRSCHLTFEYFLGHNHPGIRVF